MAGCRRQGRWSSRRKGKAGGAHVATSGNANKVIGYGGRGGTPGVSRLSRIPVRFATLGPFLVESRPIGGRGAARSPGADVGDLVENADPSEYTELAVLLNEHVISSVVLGMGYHGYCRFADDGERRPILR